MQELMGQIDAQMVALPTWVQYWMNWMGIIFIASLLFVWKHKAARYAIPAFLLAMVTGMVAFSLGHNVHLMGVGHWLFWAPFLYYLLKVEVKRSDFNFSTPYGIWVVLISATILISLVFDARDIILVLLGHK